MWWLNEVEVAQGGANGPTIKLRASLSALIERHADALFVLGMVDRNNRIDEGENPGKGWDDEFVVGEVRRVLSEKPATAPASAPAQGERAGEREAFEAWATPTAHLSICRVGDEYHYGSTVWAWKAWQARASVAQPEAQCPNCGGTKKPHALDPQWRGRCECAQPEAPAPAPTDARKLCTCDGAGRGPGRACVVKAGSRLGELWRCAQGADAAPAPAFIGQQFNATAAAAILATPANTVALTLPTAQPAREPVDYQARMFSPGVGWGSWMRTDRDSARIFRSVTGYEVRELYASPAPDRALTEDRPQWRDGVR
jgi:hypothetical protein